MSVSDEVALHIAQARRICALTGAGLSHDSGIPTFRGAQNSLWEQFDPGSLATAAAWEADKELVWGWYLWRMGMVRRAQPNAGHEALARLQATANLVIVTQNVDNLHERAGSHDTIHLHGELFKCRCFDCGNPHDDVDLSGVAPDRPELRVAPPRCGACGGDVRPGVVWFNESMPEQPWLRAVSAVESCDLLLVIGTSGLVHPAASLPGLGRRNGATIIEINPSTTPLTPLAQIHWPVSASMLAQAIGTAPTRQ